MGEPITHNGDAAASNVAGRETALLEALWRGDELAAALRAAESALAARDRELRRVEETVAELSEIAEGANAAIAELRAELADALKYVGQRDAVAAELFRIAVRYEADQQQGARRVRHPGAGENVSVICSSRRALRWWGQMRRMWRKTS